MLKINYSNERGRGMFADCFIAAGTILEDAPVILVPPEQMPLIKDTVLFEYFFQWKLDGQETCAICLGYGSITITPPSVRMQPTSGCTTS
jgi:hypothetical protein